jgi:hypothetical protein
MGPSAGKGGSHQRGCSMGGTSQEVVSIPAISPFSSSRKAEGPPPGGTAAATPCRNSVRPRHASCRTSEQARTSPCPSEHNPRSYRVGVGAPAPKHPSPPSPPKKGGHVLHLLEIARLFSICHALHLPGTSMCKALQNLIRTSRYYRSIRTCQHFRICHARTGFARHFRICHAL